VAKTNELKRRSIVMAPLDDFNGTVVPHFAVVLSPDDAIARGEPIVVAGISTTYKTPLPEGQFYMDYTPGSVHPMTGLSESCVVKGDWVNIIRRSDILSIVGQCKAATFRQLIQYINANLPPGLAAF
jgi:hypothetical protein